MGGLFWGGYQLIYHPKTPLPRGWNPTVPLAVSDDVTPLTPWKMERALTTPAACFTTLEAAATFATLPDLEASESCHIRGRLDLSGVAGAALAPVETRCAIALRMAMWTTHDLAPKARELFGADLTGVDQIGSYNCRRMRTSSGASNRWSTHATADAIDITGFRLSDGTRLRLIDDWDDSGRKGTFLKAARDSACTWFRVTLSPDYNTLHADHFHLQSKGWGLCR
ncbi:MAG: extensin family protein [Pseudomonadota bacterium]